MGLLDKCYNVLTLGTSLALFAPFAVSARGRVRLLERYGLWRVRTPKPVLWFHAASVGEVNGLLPLLKAVREKYSGNALLLSATSPEGLSKGEQSVDFARLLPFDSRLWYRCAARGLNFEMCLISETEIWPAMLAVLKEKGIPTVLVNARLSDYSWNKYRRLRPLTKRLFQEISLVCAVDQVSAERFLALGVPSQRVRICGNSKYDTSPRYALSDKPARKRKYFNNDFPVLTLGSLRSGEETTWFPAIARAKAEGLNFNVAIAPRHLTRLSYFEEKLRAFQISFCKAPVGADCGVLLMDRFGALEELYSISDLAFVGGTLVDWGGHNPLEPAMYGVGVLFGPYTSKISEIRVALESRGGCGPLTDNESAYQYILKLCDESTTSQMGQAAFSVFNEFSGATNRIVEALDGLGNSLPRSQT